MAARNWGSWGMDKLGLFTAVLYLDFDRGTRSWCSAKDCGHGACSVHDAVDKTWRYLNFFEHRAFLTCSPPRVRCSEQGVRQVSVPWARPGSGFTLLFEALALSFTAAPTEANPGQRLQGRSSCND